MASKSTERGKTQEIELDLDLNDQRRLERFARELVEHLRDLHAAKGVRKADIKVRIGERKRKPTRKGEPTTVKGAVIPAAYLQPFLSTAPTSRPEWLMFNGLLSAIGITHVVHHNEFDLIKSARARMPYSSVRMLASRLDLKPDKLARLIGIDAAMYRENAQKKITPQASAAVLGIMAVVAKGLELFDSQQALNTWLSTPQPELDKATPLSLLDTEIGITKVHHLLDSLLHGIYT
jgi:putative toxin-antitoxin system antitoxin component (TIGR02293 family)